MKVPRLFNYVGRNPNKTGTEIANDLGLNKHNMVVYINQANRSKYARVKDDKIINGGNGYLLKSKAEAQEKLDSGEMRIKLSLNILTNHVTKDVVYESQVEATTLYLEIMPKLLSEISSAIKSLTSLPSKKKQIELLKNKINKLEKEVGE